MPFPTNLDCITRAEKELGVRLPDSFREYLCSTNGGELSLGDDYWQIFPVFDDSDRKRASRSANHIVRETEFARSCSGFPSAAIAVAANGEGDYLLLQPGANDSSLLDPRVYRWDHESRGVVVASEDFEIVVESLLRRWSEDGQMTKAWQDVLAQFEQVAENNAAISPMHMLVRDIAATEFAGQLHPWTSMLDLCISQTASASRHESPYLRVRLLSESEIEFRNMDTAIADRQWCRIESPENAMGRLLSFFEQLNWFGGR